MTTPGREYDPAVCALIHAGIDEKLGHISRKIDAMDARLFKDNGSLSVQTRLDRMGRVVAGMTWALGIIGSTLLTSLTIALVRMWRAGA